MSPLLRRIVGSIIAVCLLLFAVFCGRAEPFDKRYTAEAPASAIDWEKRLAELGYRLGNVAESLPPEASHSFTLYARAAALIDADTGRILYGKDELTEYPMASTTKIMTCIIALEYGNLDDVVTVSSNAASQPEVRLGIRSGETYVLRDLLYGTMLTSYNDCAVAIAEHIGGSVEGFAELMNQKAKDLGCYSTWYITPNGLDAENEGGVHRTTASELAKIMAYAIKNDEFLAITRTPSHSFADCSGKRQFTAVNKNAFLSMIDGALSGKTGFTNNAGYCYVGALTRDGRTYVAAVLGSGWPPNKNYKWSDTRALMNYGLSNYSLIQVGQNDLITEAVIPVDNGITGGARVSVHWTSKTVLTGEWEAFTASVRIPERLNAPLPAGAVIGNIQIYLEGEAVLLLPVVLEESVEAFSYQYCVEHIFAGFFDILIKV